MRFRILVLALVSALVAVSAAVAKDHPGKGPKAKSGPGCKPAVTVMLAGTLAADVDPQDGDTSFVLTVKHSNRHGRAYKAAGTATILVDANAAAGPEEPRRARSERPRPRDGQGLQGRPEGRRHAGSDGAQDRRASGGGRRRRAELLALGTRARGVRKGASGASRTHPL